MKKEKKIERKCLIKCWFEGEKKQQGRKKDQKTKFVLKI